MTPAPMDRPVRLCPAEIHRAFIFECTSINLRQMRSTAINTGFGIQLPRNGVRGLEFPQPWLCCGHRRVSPPGLGITPLYRKLGTSPGIAITLLDTVPVGRNKAKGWFWIEFIFLKIYYNK